MEEALYVQAAGDRGAYVDPATLKARVKAAAAAARSTSGAAGAGAPIADARAQVADRSAVTEVAASALDKVAASLRAPPPPPARPASLSGSGVALGIPAGLPAGSPTHGQPAAGPRIPRPPSRVSAASDGVDGDHNADDEESGDGFAHSRVRPSPREKASSGSGEALAASVHPPPRLPPAGSGGVEATAASASAVVAVPARRVEAVDGAAPRPAGGAGDAEGRRGSMNGSVAGTSVTGGTMELRTRSYVLAARWGNAPHPWADASQPTYIPGHAIKHFPAQADGGLHCTLVLDRRPDAPPPLPVLNKWQHRQCADCGVTQTTGFFGTKALYCHYTELLFCGGCMSPRGRPIPWRVVHMLDDSEFAVSKVAAEFIDTVWDSPIIAMSAVAPATLAKAAMLKRLMGLRSRLADLVERIATAAARVDGDFDGAPEGELLSESINPTQRAAQSSLQAAAMLRDVTSIIRAELGGDNGFLMDSVEMWPLSKLVYASSKSGAARLEARLVSAFSAVNGFVAHSGLLLEERDIAAASRRVMKSTIVEEQHSDDDDAVAAAVATGGSTSAAMAPGGRLSITGAGRGGGRNSITGITVPPGASLEGGAAVPAVAPDAGPAPPPAPLSSAASGSGGGGGGLPSSSQARPATMRGPARLSGTGTPPRNALGRQSLTGAPIGAAPTSAPSSTGTGSPLGPSAESGPPVPAMAPSAMPGSASTAPGGHRSSVVGAASNSRRASATAAATPGGRPSVVGAAGGRASQVYGSAHPYGGGGDAMAAVEGVDDGDDDDEDEEEEVTYEMDDGDGGGGGGMMSGVGYGGRMSLTNAGIASGGSRRSSGVTGAGGWGSTSSGVVAYPMPPAAGATRRASAGAAVGGARR